MANINLRMEYELDFSGLDLLQVILGIKYRIMHGIVSILVQMSDRQLPALYNNYKGAIPEDRARFPRGSNRRS